MAIFTLLLGENIPTKNKTPLGRVRKRHPRMFYRCLTHGALIRDKDRIPFRWCFRTHPWEKNWHQELSWTMCSDDSGFQFRSEIWTNKRATADGKSNYKFPFNNSYHQTLRIKQKKWLKIYFKKTQGYVFFLNLFYGIFCGILMFWKLDLIEGYQKRLEPTCVARFVDFKWTGGGGSLRPREIWRIGVFHILLSYAINRRNEQPTTENTVFSCPLTIPTIKH